MGVWGNFPQHTLLWIQQNLPRRRDDLDSESNDPHSLFPFSIPLSFPSSSAFLLLSFCSLTLFYKPPSCSTDDPARTSWTSKEGRCFTESWGLPFFFFFFSSSCWGKAHSPVSVNIPRVAETLPLVGKKRGAFGTLAFLSVRVIILYQDLGSKLGPDY